MLLKLTLFQFALAIAESHKHFYRKDYTYFEEFDAYYKLHYDTKDFLSTYDIAFMTCDDEGSQLFYPKLKEEWTVAKKLSASLDEPLPANATDILVGIHDEIGVGEFITVDGHSTPSPIQNLVSGQDCVTMEIESGVLDAKACNANSYRPFICKKVDETRCPTIDQAYFYSKETKKCYKFNDKPKTWSEAMHTCFMEGGLLVVIESSAEANIINDHLNQQFRYFIGLRKVYPKNQLYTVKGQNLGEVFERWLNNINDEVLQDCGVTYSYSNLLYLSTNQCQDRLPFVCEMMPNAL